MSFRGGGEGCWGRCFLKGTQTTQAATTNRLQNCLRNIVKLTKSVIGRNGKMNRSAVAGMAREASFFITAPLKEQGCVT